MGSKVTFDPANLLITVNSSVTELDVGMDLYSDWKEDFGTVANLNKVPPAFVESFGGNDLGAGKSAGSYFVLNNAAGWRIRSWEGNHELLVDGNLYGNDTTLPLFVPTAGAFNVATLLQRALDAVSIAAGGSSPTAAQIADAVWDEATSGHVAAGSFGRMVQELERYTDEAVYVDFANGTAGTLWPLGSRRYPTSNLDDAKTIADALGRNVIRGIGGTAGTVTLTQAFDGYDLDWATEFRGQASGSTLPLNCASFSTFSTIMRGIQAWNFASNAFVFMYDGTIGNTAQSTTEDVVGVFYRCSMQSGLTVNCGFSAFYDCYEDQNNLPAPILDCLGSFGNAPITLRDYAGRVKIRDWTGGVAQIIATSKGGAEVECENFTGGSGRIVALYGIGQLINSSPSFLGSFDVDGLVVPTDIQRTLGLLHGQGIVDNHQYDPITGDLTDARLRIFGPDVDISAIASGSADNADGERYRYLIGGVYAAKQQLSRWSLIRDL